MNNTEQIIVDYLDQLERNLGGRTGERGEILSEIEAHIRSQLRDSAAEDLTLSTKSVHKVLESLGSPEEIALEFYRSGEGTAPMGVLDPQPSNTGKIVFFVVLGIIALLALPIAMPLLTSMLWSVF